MDRPSFRFRLTKAALGLSFSAVQILRALHQSLDKLAVGAVAGELALGVYGAASRFAQFSTFLTMAVSRITYPHFFRHGAGGIRRALRFGLKLLPVTIAVGFLAAAALALSAFILEPVLGPSYTGAAHYLLLLALLPVGTALQNLAGDVLSGSDRQPQRLIALLAGIFCTAGLIWGGLIYNGIAGAAIGYVVGIFVTAGWTAIMVGICTMREKRQA